MPAPHPGKIRRAGPEDFSTLWMIEKAAHSHPWAEETLRAMLKGDSRQCWLLFVDDAPIAFAILQTVRDEASLLNIATLPAWQGQGHGRRLLAQILHELVANAVVSSVFLEVRSGNSQAIRLYEACGFVETGRRKNYYPAVNGKREDAIVMALPLREMA